MINALNTEFVAAVDMLYKKNPVADTILNLTLDRHCKIIIPMQKI